MTFKEVGLADIPIAPGAAGLYNTCSRLSSHHPSFSTHSGASFLPTFSLDPPSHQEIWAKSSLNLSEKCGLPSSNAAIQQLVSSWKETGFRPPTFLSPPSKQINLPSDTLIHLSTLAIRLDTLYLVFKGSSTHNAGAEFQGMSSGDPTKAGIPQDDAAKEEVKRQLEERELKSLLDTYGGDALRGESFYCSIWFILLLELTLSLDPSSSNMLSSKQPDTFWKFAKSEQPDQIMTRFLRARKWDVKRALAMMATCLKVSTSIFLRVLVAQ